MRRASQSEREEFVTLIQQHAGGDPAGRRNLAQRLMRHGTAVRRAQENYYKGGAEKIEKIFPAIAELCQTFDCLPRFNADTRLHTMVIEVRSGYSNSSDKSRTGRKGIICPTS